MYLTNFVCIYIYTYYIYIYIYIVKEIWLLPTIPMTTVERIWNPCGVPLMKSRSSDQMTMIILLFHDMQKLVAQSRSMRFLPQRFSVQDSQVAPLTTDWFGMKSSAMSVFSMAVTLTAVLMGTLQGCGSSEEGGAVASGCSSSIVDSCISAFNTTAAMAGDCSEITTFLTCFAGCCDYDMVANPPTVTTLDGVQPYLSVGSTAINYWAGASTENSCGSTVSCTTTTVVTTVTMTATTTAKTIAWAWDGLRTWYAWATALWY